MSTKKSVDWERVELEYRAGIKSLRELAAAHGVSHTAINKRARAAGWERDLRARIQARAETKVSTAVVSSEVAAATKLREAEIVEANAEAIARVRLAHRSDIRRARELAIRLLTELEAQTSQPDLLERLGEIMRDPDGAGRDALNDLYRRVVSLTGRVTNLKTLSDALRNLIGLEREAWALDAHQERDPNDPGNLADLPDDDLQRRIEAIHARLGYTRASGAAAAA